VKTCMAACQGRLELTRGQERGLVASLVLQSPSEPRLAGASGGE
jgi:hypothetical protein